MMIQYKLQKNYKGDEVSITIVGKNISIPMNPENTDYQAYLKWLEEGNTPLPASTEGNNNSATLNMENT